MGYRIDASIIEWREGEPEKSERTNPFFRALYENVSTMLGAGERFLHQLEAREHTAQVDSDMREQREQEFRAASLPVLFCSPTMELGVDIAQLNTVYMRNVPPTAANYAQRSGRAGRSGQPALVVTYCAAKSPHDQYFFRDPARMVAGVVNAPTIDLANEELLKSHLHAVWLAETGQKLPPSIKDVLDLSQEDELRVKAELADALDSTTPRDRAARRALAILGMLTDELQPELAPWYGSAWLDSVISGAFLQFGQAFERWRSLFRATTRQMKAAHAIEMNHAIGERERKEAKERYDEARIQHDLLLESSPTFNSDFYTYRYLAGQGFLPGYNFPRLPLMAFIPARREKVGRDSFLSRPRFLGLSEFGPQSIIYHEGSTYRVRKAILGVRDEESVTTSARLPVRTARLCPACGYAHFDQEKDFERCVNCHAALDGGRSLLSLYRIEQVSTRRATRITSDEEERQRQGYEVITSLRFGQADGRPQCISVEYSEGGEALLELRYGPAATLWRVNLGWRRRKEKTIYGFNIDVTTGQWSKDQQAPEDADDDTSHEARVVQRIIPFVEDRKNCLVVHPKVTLDEAARATFQYALKRGIETTFQLESSELAAEALPDLERRHAILFYESAEGGAGVLTRLASDPDALKAVARGALEMCHYASVSGHWTDHTDLTNLDEDCEAGCYKCLLSYANQPEHKTIDRRDTAVLDLLCRLSRAEGERGAIGRSSAELFEALSNLSLSSLEQAWLAHVQECAYALPDKAQPLLEDVRHPSGLRLLHHPGAHLYRRSASRDRPAAPDRPPDWRPARRGRLYRDPLPEGAGSLACPLRAVRVRFRHRQTPRGSSITMALTAEQFQPGNLVRARGREWVVLPETRDQVLRLRPLGGSEDDATVIYLPLERTPPEPATFPAPDPAKSGSQAAGLLMRDALRLRLRAGAGPFRSFGNLAVEPRAYQLVPLLMALRQDVIRLLIADDVGIGKTIEAGLIARELLDRGEIERLTVICPPHLCEQWQKELASKFLIETEVVRTGTAGRLERGLPAGQSIFEVYPFTVVSLDYIKSERRKDDFVRACPELVIVEEAHGCVGATGTSRHLRYRLLRDLANTPNRHMLFLTATPHSGDEEAFHNLLGMLDERFVALQGLPEGPERTRLREELARNFVQRRRPDIQEWKDSTVFPDRETAETTYILTGEWGRLFDAVLAYARTMVERAEGKSMLQQRMNWWAALALLRCVSSSPAAAAVALNTRLRAVEGLSEDLQVAEIERTAAETVLDGQSDDELNIDETVPAGTIEDAETNEADAHALRQLIARAEALKGAGKDPKLTVLTREVKKLVADGFRPVIFCRYIATAHYVAEELKQSLPERQTQVVAITGELTPEQREEHVQRLGDTEENEGRTPVLVATDCLSEGVNLQHAFNAVLHYDLVWNPTRHEQREGRVDRFGQPDKVVRALMLYGENNPVDGAVLQGHPAQGRENPQRTRGQRAHARRQQQGDGNHYAGGASPHGRHFGRPESAPLRLRSGRAPAGDQLGKRA